MSSVLTPGRAVGLAHTGRESGGPDAAKPARAAAQHLAFRLACEEYALDILQVQEIRSYAKPTRLPQMPSYLKGVIDLRGTIVPVIDLRTRLGFDPSETEAAAVTIVLAIGRAVLGVIVDAVSDVVDIPAEAIQALPTLAPSDLAHVIGMASLRDAGQDRLLILLDAARLACDVNTFRPETN